MSREGGLKICRERTGAIGGGTTVTHRKFEPSL